MDWLIWIVSGYVLLFFHIWVHELGHYIVGRRIVHIPKKHIKIKLFQYPPHVSLKDPYGNWLAPNDKTGNYIETYSSYDPDGKNSLSFVLGGLVLQTTVFLLTAVCIIDFFWNHTALANFIVGGSFVFNTIYILGDLVAYRWTKKPSGDASAALQIAPSKTALVIGLILLSYIVSYIYVGFY